METLRKVTDRTPTAEGWYVVKAFSGVMLFETKFLHGDEKIWGEAIEYWYEPIDDIIANMQAEIDSLKESKSAVRATKESTIKRIVEQHKNEAISFAEWVDTNYSKRAAGRFIKLGTSDGKLYTIPELYKIFINEPI